MTARDTIVGCILAGGRSSRMGGGDKPLRPLGGRPMLATVIDRLQSQLRSIVLNANGDPHRFAPFGLPVVGDAITGFAGPLAGVSACMNWVAENRPEASHIVTVAADTPFFPIDLVDRLADASAMRPDTIAMATSDGHRHPVFSLWPMALRHDLAAWLQETDTYKVIVWARRHRLEMVEFAITGSGPEAVDPFFNVNTPEDLLQAEQCHIQLTRLAAQE